MLCMFTDDHLLYVLVDNVETFTRQVKLVAERCSLDRRGELCILNCCVMLAEVDNDGI